jgi:hypothetical protein
VRVRQPKSGEHGQHTPEEALAIMRSMATRWSDADIAATLNRMGHADGSGKDLDRPPRPVAAHGAQGSAATHPSRPVSHQQIDDENCSHA